MKKLTKTLLGKTALSSLARFAKPKGQVIGDDERGVAAIEFSLIAPLMIAMYLGLAELALAISADRKASESAFVINDLVSQTVAIDKAEAEDLLQIASRLSGAKIEDDFSVSIESYVDDGTGNIVLDGQVILNETSGPALPDFDPSQLNSTLVSASSGIVIARVGVRYTPMGEIIRNFDGEGDKLFSDIIVLQEIAYNKPRDSAQIRIGDDPGDRFTCIGGGGAAGVDCTLQKAGSST